MRVFLLTCVGLSSLALGCAAITETESPRAMKGSPAPEAVGRAPSVTADSSDRDYTRWLTKWKQKDQGLNLHIGVPTGVHFLTGGKFRRVMESAGAVTGITTALNFPVSRKSAVGPYLLLQRYNAEVKHSEMFWEFSLLGGGVRYLLLHENEGDLYLRADGGYVFGRGMEDDTITHPGFDRTLFKRDDPNQFEPRDVHGYMLGTAVGGEFFGKTPFGAGVEVAYRYQDGTKGFTAHWLGLNLTFTVRF